jgi:uncharacterized protein
MATNAIQNFQIPVADMSRAAKFYGDLLNCEITSVELRGTRLGMLPFDESRNGVGGTLIQAEGMSPSQKGTIVYLHTEGDLNDSIAKVKSLGGKIVMEKTSLGDGNGFCAVIVDSEGNRVGLFSKS